MADASDQGARVAVIVIAAAWHLGSRCRPCCGPGGDGGSRRGGGGLAGDRAGRGRDRGTAAAPGLPPAGPLAVALLAVDAAVVAGAGERFLFSTANWVWGGLAWFFLLVLWRRPVRWLLLMLAAHGTIALAAVVLYGATAPADLSRAAMYVYGTSPCRWRSSSARRRSPQARDRAATAAATLAVAAEQEAAERARTERQARLALVSGTAEEGAGRAGGGRRRPGRPGGTAARGAGRGPAAPADRRVGRRAGRAAARSCARRPTWPSASGLPIDLVSVGTPPELPVGIRRGLADPLTAALAGARGWLGSPWWRARTRWWSAW
ncbi:hypothetical protein V2I01_05830 [Micromonospora sp. BRA006-A]|nr:hypothetical protein [Micromonospora sp. BRA006-A]